MQEFDNIFELCREGDAPAWESLIKNYQGRVYAVALYYLKNKDDALDAAQDTFIKVYDRLHRFRGREQRSFFTLAANHYP